MTLLGCFAVITASSARAATAVEAETSIYDAFATVLAAASFHKIGIARVRLTLAPVGYDLAAILSAAAIHRK